MVTTSLAKCKTEERLDLIYKRFCAMLFAYQNIELVHWDCLLFAMRESRSESVCIPNELWIFSLAKCKEYERLELIY